jgi:hypothetical protein
MLAAHPSALAPIAVDEAGSAVELGTAAAVFVGVVLAVVTVMFVLRQRHRSEAIRSLGDPEQEALEESARRARLDEQLRAVEHRLRARADGAATDVDPAGPDEPGPSPSSA